MSLSVRPRVHVAAIALLLAVASPAVAPHVAHAGAPTAAQLEQAKKAYAEGKAKFDKGNFGDAVEKFKESYRLSKNPLLLYNIALTFERLGNAEMALFYYKKFLADAPADAAQRGDAEKSVAALEKAGTTASGADGAAPAGGDQDSAASDEPPADEVKPPPPPKKKRPPAACTAEDVQHQIVEDAPPGKPLDLSAFVPEECGWEVVLYYRGKGDDKFIAAPMRARYNELVARIPAAKMAGNAIQYFLEVKGGDGAVVTRVGKSTSPNVVYLDEAAKPRFYPDLDDSGAGATSGAVDDAPTGDDDDNPLAGTRKVVASDDGPGDAAPGTPEGRGKPDYLKWGTTGAAGGLLILSGTFYFMAGSWATSLEGEANASQEGSCPDKGGPPCRTYDDYRKNIESKGKSFETWSKVTFGVGLVATGVAGYLWYRESQKKKHAGERATARTTTGLDSLVATPVAGDGVYGAAAALRF